MIDFIVKYYKYIALALYVLLEFLFLILLMLNKKQKNPVFERVLGALPGLISLVEDKVGSGCGEKKKALVVELALDLYFRLTGIRLSNDSTIAHDISSAIEDILSAPQKKGI